MSFAKNKYILTVCLLLVIGFSVRLIGISNLPSGLNQDEASIGYEAYSILKTGLDRNGYSYPVHLESWGSGQNALYAYLSIPFIHFFGLNAFSVRIVNAIFSCLSLFLFFLLFKLMFDRKKSLAALALFAIFPWSIMSARWGLESNIFPSIFLAAVYFLIIGFKSSQKYYLVSFFLFAISLYSYGTAYLVLPLFFAGIIPYLLITKNITVKYFLLSLVVFFIVATPIILFVFINHLDLKSIHFLGLSIPRLEANRTTVIFNLFQDNFFFTLIKNTLRFLSVLVLQSDGSKYNAIPMFGTIYPLSMIFFVVGLFKILKNKNYKSQPFHYIFLCWLFCSVILGLMSHVNINRLNIIFIPILYFVVLGIFEVFEMLKPEFQKNYKYLIMGFYSLLFVFFAGYYSFFFREDIKSEFSYGLKDAIQFAENRNQTDSINVTTQTINMPYIYVCFYNHLNPDEFRKTVKYTSNTIHAEFRGVERIGRYTFGTNLLNSNTIHILSEGEMKEKHSPIAFSRHFGNYYVVKFY